MQIVNTLSPIPSPRDSLAEKKDRSYTVPGQTEVLAPPRCQTTALQEDKSRDALPVAQTGSSVPAQIDNADGKALCRFCGSKQLYESRSLLVGAVVFLIRGVVAIGLFRAALSVFPVLREFNPAMVFAFCFFSSYGYFQGNVGNYVTCKACRKPQ